MPDLQAMLDNLIAAFTYVDFIIVFVLFASTISGLVVGGLRIGVSYLCWLLSLSAAIYITPLILPTLPILFKGPVYGYFIVGFAIFLVIFLVAKSVAYIFNKLIFLSGPSTSGMIIGGTLGLLRGHIIISIVYLLILFAFGQPFRAIENAFTTQYVARYTQWAIHEAIPEIRNWELAIPSVPDSFVQALVQDNNVRIAMEQLTNLASATIIPISEEILEIDELPNIEALQDSTVTN